ncbi:Beta-galactosidase 13 [Sesamum angolense]|uniref:beta-galactosidase n=1 Tax=Sesamum angolense TaxID=2727404 RepID=A0AAE2C1A3_9LAMI|nr:Beta-galactosidase 13 [Sesamum angolense]
MATIGGFLFVALLSLLVANACGSSSPVVTYDSRSLIINGSRELLFSGSIHYPRSTPDMWPDIIRKAKEGGLNIIQTYVFWNLHEPNQGEHHMQKYAEKVINMMKQEKLFADQGGPIVMMQAIQSIRRHPSQRAAEDISFAVARFFTRNGTLNNYYMYYGGSNFGRTSSSSFVTTRYYDEAPLDEYGLRREPKFGHLRDLHRALKLSKKPLLRGTPKVERISQDLEITTYEKPSENLCVAFLTNNDTREAKTIHFRGKDYYLPSKSVSILPDCKTVVYNTAAIVAQHSSRNFVVSQQAKFSKWEMFKETIPTINDLTDRTPAPKELYSFTKDVSDYAWYSTSIKIDARDLPMRPDVRPGIHIASLGHALLAFVNGEYVGFEHGSNVEKSHIFRKPVNLKPGDNNITLLAMTVGFPNSGAYMEKRFAGPRAVTLEGLMSGTLDITNNKWGQQTYFDAPEGTNPVALRMMSMAKGMVWVNGQSIGRYWVSYNSPLGRPTQEEYHVPRSFLKPKDNLLVVFEETGGNPEKIDILVVNRDTICSVITEYHPPSVNSWERKGDELRALVNPVREVELTCPDKKVIKKVEFVGFGEVDGACGAFKPGKCNSNSKAIKLVESLCLGKKECKVPFERERLADVGKDACPDVSKTLAIQVACS